MLKKFEKKISKFVEKIDKRVSWLVIFTFFGVILMYAMAMTKSYTNQKQNSTDMYNRSMYELIGNVQNIEVLVAKSRITSTKNISIITYADIISQSNLAKDNLSALPVDQNAMSNVSKFLTQVSGYSLTLIQKFNSKGNIEQKDYDDLKTINKYAKSLEETLNSIYKELNAGKIKWDELQDVAQRELSDEDSIVMKDLVSISKSFTDYEGLIYDGAFSSHVEKGEAKSLTGAEVSVEKATEKVKECVQAMWTEDSPNKKKISGITYTGENSGTLDIYNFEVMFENTSDVVDVQITKKDGKLLLIVYDRKVKEKKLSEKQCEEIGTKYLDKLGLKNMKATYYLQVDNMITINYAYQQSGVVIYPDLIKVKIAMDSGDVCSVESKGYIFNHVERTNLTPEITMDEAKSVLNKDIKVLSSSLAIIPTDFNTEVLTYEFKGKIEGNEYLIYINAKTKEEQNVLYIINTPGGTLTM